VLFSIPLLLLLSCPLLLLFPGLVNAFQSGVPLGQALQQMGVALFCSFVFCLVPVVFLFIILWIDVIRGFSLHRNLNLSIRQAFNTVPQTDTFNIEN